MNFDEWIAEHTLCIVGLFRTVDGNSNEPLQRAAIGLGDSCALGKWIYGEGRRYKASLRYRDLVTKHVRFHVVATRILRKVEGDDRAGAKALCDRTLAGTSAALLRAIVDLKPQVMESYCAERGPDQASARRKRGGKR